MSAFPDRVIIRNARQHNLKGITVELPRRALTVITGPSGSGKSSLAFDTLYAEGQRRYIESLSTYAKQFLERMPKPLVDGIEGISPAVAIEQKNPTTSSRSTVGTATEIYDFLRLLWARAGIPHCVNCGQVVKVDTVQEVVDALIAQCGVRSAECGVDGTGTGIAHSALRTPHSALVTPFPLPASAHRPDVDVAAQLRAAGFVRAQADGALLRLDEPDAERRMREAAEVLVVVDRLAVLEANRGRLADAVATAFSEGEGVALALANGDRRRFCEHPACSACGCAAPVLTPTLFSFNNPRGACPTCNGFGAVLEYDESLIVPDPGRSLAKGALDPWTKPRYDGRRRLLRETARARGIDLDAPWREIPARDRQFLLRNKGGRYLGIFPFLERLEEKRYKQYIRVFLRQYQLAKTCPSCAGARLKPESLAVRVAGKTIAEAAALTSTELDRWLAELKLPAFQQQVADHILGELRARVGFVNDVGLGYLTLDRPTRTLSAGAGRARSRHADRSVPVRRKVDRCPIGAPACRAVARRQGRATPQPRRRRRAHSTRHTHRRHRRIGIRKVDAGARCAVPSARSATARRTHCQATPRRAGWRREGPERVGGAGGRRLHRSKTDRAHATLEPGHVCESV